MVFLFKPGFVVFNNIRVSGVNKAFDYRRYTNKRDQNFA